MSFLSRLFGSGSSGKGPKNIEAELARLEAQAANAAPGYVGTAFNKAGDLALRGEQVDRAVEYYGLAIDAFLEDMQREAARGVANKIVRVRPKAVRTLCTLTWLDLAAQHRATALLHLRDYVDAAKRAGQQARAATQIYAMAKLSTDSEFVDAVADALDSLDFPRTAREVRGWGPHGSPEALEDTGELADACLRAAVNSSQSRDLLDDADAPEVKGAERERGDGDDGDETREGGYDHADLREADSEFGDDFDDGEDDEERDDEVEADDGTVAASASASDGRERGDSGTDGQSAEARSGKGSRKSRKKRRRGDRRG